MYRESFRGLIFLITPLLVGVLMTLIPALMTAQTAGSARSLAMGSTGVASETESHSVFVNPAMMMRTPSSVSVSWVRFVGMGELTKITAASVLQAGRLRYGLGIRRFGTSFYHRTRLTVATAYPLGNLLIGAGGTYKRIYQGESYAALHAFEIHAGVVIKLDEGIVAAFRAANLFQASYAGTREELPSDLAAGFDFQLHPMLRTTVDLVKDLRYPVSLRWGVEWSPVDILGIYAGYSTRPQTYAAGFRMHVAGWKLTFAFQQHLPLGLTPALDAAFPIQKRQSPES